MKKLFSLLVAGTMMLGMVACAPKTGTESKKPAESKKATAGKATEKQKDDKKPAAGAIALKLWGSQDDQEFLNERVKAFEAAHKDKKFDIQVSVVGEPDAQTKVLEDLDAAADVFAMPNDQVKELVKAGALTKVSRKNDLEYITKQETGADAFSIGKDLYAFPFAADNGYFMYYDKRVLSADDVKDLDTMLAKAAKAKKKVHMDIANGWYIASFFVGNGGKFEVDDKGVQKVNFNDANGVAAGEAIKAFAASPAFATGDDNAMKEGFTKGTLCAAVSGTWNAADLKKILGDGYAAAKLPTFTAAGKKVQMGSFAGYKGYGINSHSKHKAEAMDLAMFLTSEESQAKRFQMRGTGPANLKVQQSEAVKKDVALSALMAQQKFSVSQNNVLGSYWNPAGAFGKAMLDKSTESVKKLLDEMVKQIQQPATK